RSRKEGIEMSGVVAGSLDFVTIADTGTMSTVNAGLTCAAPTFQVRSSIIWTPGSNRPASNACAFSSTIAGPMGVGGAMNTDPRFVSAVANDYHLNANSPAIDAVDVGPELDFEGDPRPRGDRFDLGADEAP